MTEPLQPKEQPVSKNLLTEDRTITVTQETLRKKYGHLLEDYRVMSSEVADLRVTYFREKSLQIAQEMVEKENELRLLRAAALPDQTRIGELEKQIADLAARWTDLHERIGHEKALNRTIHLYTHYRDVYHETKKEMNARGFSPTLPNQETREQAMDAQVNRITAIMDNRARLNTVITLADKAFPDPRDKDAKPDPEAVKRLPAAIDEYNTHLPKDAQPLAAAPGSKDFWADLQRRTLRVMDQLHAEIHHTTPELAHIEELYRSYAGAKTDADRKKLLQDMRRFTDDIVSRHVQDGPGKPHNETYEAAAEMNMFARSEALPSAADAEKQRTLLPRVKPEAVLLTAELLERYVDQLQASKQANAEARRELVLKIHKTLVDLLGNQHDLLRELGGWENIRTGYTGEGKPVGDLPDLAPGLREAHRAECDVRADEVRLMLKDMRDVTLRATFSERVAGKASRYIYEPARRLLKKIDNLINPADPALKTGPQESVPEILEGFDRQTIEDVDQDIELFQTMIKQSPTEQLKEARQRLTPNDLQKMTQEAPALSREDIRQASLSPDPRTRIRAWLAIEARLTGDLERLGQEQFKTLKRLEVAGTGEKQRLEELQQFIEDAREAIRNFLVTIGIILGVALAAYAGMKLVGWWWSTRHIRAMKRATRAMEQVSEEQRTFLLQERRRLEVREAQLAEQQQQMEAEVQRHQEQLTSAEAERDAALTHQEELETQLREMQAQLQATQKEQELLNDRIEELLAQQLELEKQSVAAEGAEDLLTDVSGNTEFPTFDEGEGI